MCVCVCVCVCACVCACVRACVCACVCVYTNYVNYVKNYVILCKSSVKHTHCIYLENMSMYFHEYIYIQIIDIIYTYFKCINLTYFS